MPLNSDFSRSKRFCTKSLAAAERLKGKGEPPYFFLGVTLFSCDSMAATYPKRHGDRRSEVELCHDYQRKVALAIAGSYKREAPGTAGAGNGQGRKPQWSAPTVPVRLPQSFRNGRTLEELIQIAREWDS